MSEENKSQIRQIATRWRKALDSPVTFILGLLTLASLYFGAVEWRVRTIVKDPEFIATVARHARPALVFDADSRVLADMGALQYLESVPLVELAPEAEKGYHTKITVQPRDFLPAEPVIEALDTGPVSVETRRSKGLSWEITLSRRYALMTAGGRPQTVSSPRYRLEIVPPY